MKRYFIGFIECLEGVNKVVIPKKSTVVGGRFPTPPHSRRPSPRAGKMRTPTTWTEIHARLTRCITARVFCQGWRISTEPLKY